jgi:hypothetical protein
MLLSLLFVFHTPSHTLLLQSQGNGRYMAETHFPGSSTKTLPSTVGRHDGHQDGHLNCVAMQVLSSLTMVDLFIVNLQTAWLDSYIFHFTR